MTDVVRDGRAVFRTRLEYDTRLRSSLQRLQLEDYRVDVVIAETTASDWPGDLAGRLLLSLSRLARSGHGTAESATDLFEAMLDSTLDHGYFGAPLAEVVDEQQVACHGWVTAAYLQYGFLTGDPRAFAAADRVVDGLILPALSRFSDYPVKRDLVADGAPSGTATKVVNNWLISTDTWCILLALNGLVPYTEHKRRDDVVAASEALIATLSSLDLLGNRVQLHAALAAARNAAHFSELTGSEAAHEAASSVYKTYARHARTLNWATYNWFDREDSWTEPCAIVDSIGLGLALWRQTGDSKYVRDVAFIEHNALGFAQKRGGGFGLDTVSTPSEPVIRVIHEDARWCCTIRGALGLIDLRDRSVSWTETGIEVLLPRAGRLTGVDERDGWELDFSGVADDGCIAITVSSAPPSAAPLVVRGPRLEESRALEARAGATVTVRIVRDSYDRALGNDQEMIVINDAIMARMDGALVALGELGPRVSKGEVVSLAHDVNRYAMLD